MNESMLNTWEKRWDDDISESQITLLGKIMFKAKAKAIREMVIPFHPQEIFEVGTGMGYTLQVFTELNIKSHGIDASKNSVRACLKKGLKVECRKVEEETGKYELVASDGMLEHFLNFEPYAEHLMRISKRYVLLIQPDHDSFRGKTLAYFSELIRGDSNVFEYNYRIRDFIDIFKNHGFELKSRKGIFGKVFCLLLFETRDAPGGGSRCR